MATTPEIKLRSRIRFLAESLEGITLFLVVFTTWPILGRWLRDWGSSQDERVRAWPGDDFTEDPNEVFTRGVSVAAEPQDVWPWLVQFGLGRAGFYSYELLERIAGIPVRNVEQILPQHQVLRAGGEIKLHPNAPGIPVGMVDPPTCLCFGAPSVPTDPGAADPRRSWSLYVVPQPDGGSRLVLRSCVEALRLPTLPKRIGLALEVPMDFLMEQRMLRTIKRLAESRV